MDQFYYILFTLFCMFQIYEAVVWNLCNLFEVYNADFYPDYYFFKRIFFVFYNCICGSCKNPYFNFLTFRSKACIFWCYLGFIFLLFYF